MGTIIVSDNVSLDGVTQDRGGTEVRPVPPVSVKFRRPPEPGQPAAGSSPPPA
jgi:hypothetical protein